MRCGGSARPKENAGMAVSVGLCRAVVRRTCVQTGGGGVLQLRDGKAMFESVTISSSEAFVSTALAAADPVGV
jgi:hypothetical protein